MSGVEDDPRGHREDDPRGHRYLPDHGTIRWRDKPLTAHDVTHVVWYSPWRSFEHTDPAKYRTDNRYHIIGHVPVMMIDDRYWQGNRMPEMPG